jgi:hypothetical protein
MVYEKETKKSMAYEKYEYFFVVYEIFADKSMYIFTYIVLISYLLISCL